jgi:Tfp pilus assembly protein PilX
MVHHRDTSRGRRGVVLIVVLGVLVLLSLLAASFATLASVERAVGRNHLDGVRARLLAQAGVETALVRLGEVASTSGFLDDQSWTSGDGGDPRYNNTNSPRGV